MYSFQFVFFKKTIHPFHLFLIEIVETIRQVLDNKKIVGIFFDLQKTTFFLISIIMASCNSLMVLLIFLSPSSNLVLISLSIKIFLIGPYPTLYCFFSNFSARFLCWKRYFRGPVNDWFFVNWKTSLNFIYHYKQRMVGKVRKRY